MPRVLLLAMYPLDRGMWGATTRISEMRDALARRCRLDIVAGTRWRRGLRLAGYAFRGRLKGLAGIYVENATTLPGPLDLLFLGLARGLRIPTVTYVRDAQQLFPEYFTASTLKTRLSKALFLPLTRVAMRLSTRVAFPSSGLAKVVTGSADQPLLPPGSRVRSAPAVDPQARALLFVGGLRVPAHGADILFEGMRRAREQGCEVQVICVTRPGEGPAAPFPDGLRVVHAEGEEIDALLPEVVATINPRHRTPYNDLAVPIKVMEYLGYCRPVLVTDATEQARIVESYGCGVVVPDTADGIAAGMVRICTADPAQIRSWAEAARSAAEANTWDTRAATVLAWLGLGATVPERSPDE